MEEDDVSPWKIGWFNLRIHVHFAACIHQAWPKKERKLSPKQKSGLLMLILGRVLTQNWLVVEPTHLKNMQFSGWFSQKYLSCHHLYSWVVFLWMGVGLFVDWREGTINKNSFGAWSLLWFSHWFSRPSGCNHSNDLGTPWGSDFSGPVSEGDDENGFEEACIYSRLD